MKRPEPLSDHQYESLLSFRVGLRRFLRWSEQEAAATGLTPAQHQLLLAIRGHPDPRGPTIGDVAASLLVRHHSAVQLADRVEALGLIRRRREREDRRVVRLRLTPAGQARVAALSSVHLQELRRLGPLVSAGVDGLDEDRGDARRHEDRSSPDE